MPIWSQCVEEPLEIQAQRITKQYAVTGDLSGTERMPTAPALSAIGGNELLDRVFGINRGAARRGHSWAEISLWKARRSIRSPPSQHPTLTGALEVP
jgi:hypothetical protein